MLEALIEYRDEAQRIASLLIGLAMLRWGGGPERVISVIFLGLLTFPVLVLSVFTDGSIIFGDLGSLYAALDLLALAAFVTVALYANRNYTLWIAGFQLVATSAHAVRSVVEAITPMAHAIMVIGPSYFQIMLMALGLARHIARKRQYGEYRDWRINIPVRLEPVLGRGRK